MASCPESVTLDGPVTRRPLPSTSKWLVIPPFLTYDHIEVKMSIGESLGTIVVEPVSEASELPTRTKPLVRRTLRVG
jgi:phospholipase C